MAKTLIREINNIVDTKTEGLQHEPTVSYIPVASPLSAVHQRQMTASLRGVNLGGLRVAHEMRLFGKPRRLKSHEA